MLEDLSDYAAQTFEEMTERIMHTTTAATSSVAAPSATDQHTQPGAAAAVADATAMGSNGGAAGAALGAPTAGDDLVSAPVGRPGGGAWALREAPAAVAESPKTLDLALSWWRSGK